MQLCYISTTEMQVAIFGIYRSSILNPQRTFPFPQVDYLQLAYTHKVEDGTEQHVRVKRILALEQGSPLLEA